MTSQSPSENVKAIREITKVMVDSDSWLHKVTMQMLNEQKQKCIERVAEVNERSQKEPDIKPEINCEDCSGLLW